MLDLAYCYQISQLIALLEGKVPTRIMPKRTLCLPKIDSHLHQPLQQIRFAITEMNIPLTTAGLHWENEVPEY